MTGSHMEYTFSVDTQGQYYLVKCISKKPNIPFFQCRHKKIDHIFKELKKHIQFYETVKHPLNFEDSTEQERWNATDQGLGMSDF